VIGRQVVSTFNNDIFGKFSVRGKFFFSAWKWVFRGPARVKLIVAGINELLDSTLILTTKLIDTDIDLDIDMVWITA
jgi:hypothetical protein